MTQEPENTLPVVTITVSIETDTGTDIAHVDVPLVLVRQRIKDESFASCGCKVHAKLTAEQIITDIALRLVR